jgi:hypothetical protein
VSVQPFSDIESLTEFIYAGRAVLTVTSTKTGKHITYKIGRIQDSDLYGVRRLTSGDDWLYLGVIDQGEFRSTTKTPPYMKLTAEFKAFDWLSRWVNERKQMPPNVIIQHAGLCGMCGRELTDPVSIAEGYGPTCRKARLRRGL